MVNRVALLLSVQQGGLMPRPPREKSQLGTYLPTELYEQVREFSDASGIPITRIVEDALRAYLLSKHWRNDP